MRGLRYSYSDTGVVRAHAYIWARAGAIWLNLADKYGMSAIYSGVYIRVWVEIMGSHKCGAVGKTQPERGRRGQASARHPLRFPLCFRLLIIMIRTE
eukprot:COSAG01_NODE_24764_length_767_cov_1.140719_1_plen_96_part_01